MGVVFGISDWTRIPLIYLMAITVLMANQMRFFADHHFESHGEQMSMADHITDSCNYSKNDFLTWLFFPFTIRFHALHHLFPTIPYHNLPAAHTLMTEQLPADSVYHTLDQPGWWHTAKQTLGISKPEKSIASKPVIDNKTTQPVIGNKPTKPVADRLAVEQPVVRS